jgi:transposase
MRPCVIVLDNYSVHHSRIVTDEAPALAAGDVHFCYLPPYSPELNPIELVWRQVKYQDIPERSFPTDTTLQNAVETVLTARATHLRTSTNNLPRPA